MGIYRKNVLAIALLSFAAILFNPLPVLSDVIVQVPVLPPIVGSFFDVSVNISGITDLYSFQFDVSFDPTILLAQSISEGTFLSLGGSTFFVPGTIDNTLGSIAFTSDTLIGALSGVSGDGILATISFQAFALGFSSIDLSNVLLLNSIFENISASTQSGSVEVASANGTPVPEPASVLLMSTGMAAIGILRKKGREKI